MSTDVFDLAPHEQATFEAKAEPADPGRAGERRQPVPPESATPEATVPWETEDFAPDPDKLPYLQWLWRHHIPGNEFYPLAHLVLTGGPGDVWARKTLLIPSFVARDIAEVYAVGRPGITSEHLDLANRAVFAYRNSTETVDELVARRRRPTAFYGGERAASDANRKVKNAQVEGFLDLGTMPLSANGNNPTASIKEIIPKVVDAEMPEDFRTVKVACLYQYQENDINICGRPSVVGSMLCAKHGGVPIAFTQEDLKEIYNGARQRLMAATLMAVDATIELAHNAVNEAVRLKAAEVILDRTGFVPGVEIHLPGVARDGQIDKTPAQIVLERLSQLGVAAPVTEPSADGAPSEQGDASDIVEAEVVGES